MGKNNYLINREKQLRRREEKLVPQIYACLAIALHRKYGFGFKRLNDTFLYSQRLWEAYSDAGVDMLVACEVETGIEIK